MNNAAEKRGAASQSDTNAPIFETNVQVVVVVGGGSIHTDI
jgi:hypothetical protein